MSDRAASVPGFLQAVGWGAARRVPLAGDASSRRYERLFLNGATAVLMDDPAFGSGSTARFLSVGAWLAGRGYSPPRVLAARADAGLLLLEDFGDDLFTVLLASDAGLENRLYSSATDLLVDLHRHAPPRDLPALDGPALAALLMLTLDWYVPATGAPRSDAAADIPNLVASLYDGLPLGPPVTSLRDFHAGNLIWLPRRRPPADVGLLDFQDAVTTHPAYDLVSLLQDVRRDVAPATETAMIGRYLDLTGRNAATFRRAYAILGAQRQLRILGVFARLCLHFGKPAYVDLIPRVWAHLMRDLSHPDLAGLARLVALAVPEPTPERLQRIKDQCATFPDP